MCGTRSQPENNSSVRCAVLGIPTLRLQFPRLVWACCPFLVFVQSLFSFRFGGPVLAQRMRGRPTQSCPQRCLLQGRSHVHQSVCQAHVHNSQTFMESNELHMHIHRLYAQLFATQSLLFNGTIVHIQHVATHMPSFCIALACLNVCHLPACPIFHHLHGPHLQ